MTETDDTRYKLDESILDDIKTDDMKQQSSLELSSSDKVNSLPSPWDVNYEFLFKVGCGYRVSSQITEEQNDKLEYTTQGMFDVLENCRQVKKYSDIEFE